MQVNLPLVLAAMLGLLAIAGLARHFSSTAKLRNTLSVVLVVLGLLTAFLFFFSAGSLFRGYRQQPSPHSSAPSHKFLASSFAVVGASFNQRSNPSIEGTSNIRLRLLSAAPHVKR